VPRDEPWLRADDVPRVRELEPEPPVVRARDAVEGDALRDRDREREDELDRDLELEPDDELSPPSAVSA